jgi:hypothetical protein
VIEPRLFQSLSCNCLQGIISPQLMQIPAGAHSSS